VSKGKEFICPEFGQSSRDKINSTLPTGNVGAHAAIENNLVIEAKLFIENNYKICKATFLPCFEIRCFNQFVVSGRMDFLNVASILVRTNLILVLS
jgi:hypothetical protein